MTIYGGADLGWRHDHSAVVTLRRDPERLVVLSARRVPHGSWDDQLVAISKLLDGCRGACVDSTGMGALALEELRPRSPCPVVGIQFTAASKLEMMTGLAELIRPPARLAVAPDCRGADDLREELRRVIVSPTRRGVAISGKAGGGDDVVMALALAIHAVRLPPASWH
jgi:hypothetical protein